MKKVEWFDNKRAVSVLDLTRDDDGSAVMTRSNFDNLVKRNRVKVLRPGKGLGSYALVEYDTLPARFKERFEEKYGAAEELLRHHEATVVINDAARAYYASVLREDGTALTDEKVEAYTLNASVLDTLLAEWAGQRAARSRGGSGTAINWAGIHALSEQMRKATGHTLPRGAESLKNKLRVYARDGYESLISRKLTTQNSRKITEEGGRLLVALRRSRVPVYTLKQLFEEYNRRAAAAGWKTLKSPEAVKAYLARPEVEPKWYAAVYGELAAKQRFDRKQRTLLPMRRDALWYGDGTKLNLYYLGRNSRGEWVKKTTMVYEVIDAYSEMLLGYCISPTENAAMQRRAFRMAVETAGCRPFEIVTDNQGGQKKDASAEFTSRLCRVRRFTAPYTPQAKTIEQAFGRFQAQVLNSDWRSTRQNITAVRKESHANKEFLAENWRDLYTFEELCEVYARYREAWNDMPRPGAGKSRREMYYASTNPDTVPLTELDRIDLFYEETEAEFTASGVEIQVDKQKYAYEVFDGEGMPDMAFRRENTGRRFVVKYDPDDLSHVWLYERTSCGVRRVCRAEPYATIHRALQEQTPAEQDFIRATLDANKRERILRQQEGYIVEAEHGMAPEQHGLRTPRLMGLSTRTQERLADELLKERERAVYMPEEGDTEASCEPLGVGLADKAISNRTTDLENVITQF